MSNLNEKSSENPLLARSNYPHHAAPFDLIKPEHFVPALDAAIAKSNAKLTSLKKDASLPTFANTLEVLESISEQVDTVANLFFNLLGAETNDRLQALAQEIGPKLSNFSSDIVLSPEIFARIKSVYQQMPKLNLNPEQKRLLEMTYTDFVRNGANLSDADKEKLRGIDEKLSKLGPQYGENVLKATNAFELWLKPSELAGLPDSFKEAAAAAAAAKNRPGEYLVNLQSPSSQPFMKFSENREAREKVARAAASRAFGGEFDNQKIILEMVNLRHQRAELLGYKSHAHFVLEKRMAETPARVTTFLERLLKACEPAARRDVKQVQDYATQTGGPKQLQSWDFSFYSEKLKESLFDFNEESLRPYFKLENVVEGVFEVAKRLYNLSFVPIQGIPVYDPDVRVYEAFQETPSGREFMGLFYTDFFPRATKRDGAWMTTFLEQGHFDGQPVRPHISIVCNFTKPTPTQPSLLTFMEVRTLFHEFGHALHGMLSRCHYRTLAGTNVYWDFVELPSQLLENWSVEKEGLDLFARHYQTGQPMPAELAKKIKDSSKFMAGQQCLRQLTFACLDMAWHGNDPQSIVSVEKLEDEVTERMRVLPKMSGTNVSSAFSHVFAGGYSAGYYSYKWAEVLDADAFELFKEKGIFNSEVGRHFEQNILSRGGSEHPMELYKKFRGREPDPDALLRRDGLI